MNKLIPSVGVALAMAAMGSQAANAGVSFSLNIGPLSVASTPVCAPTPPVCRPTRPVVFLPAPVCIQPSPVVVYSPPVVVATPVYVHGPYHRYHRWYAGMH